MLSHKAVDELVRLPLHIDDTSAQSIDTLRAKARAHRLAHGLDLVIVDYLQLSNAGIRDNVTRDVTMVAEGLKAMAKENNVPVIALSQLSRAVEARGGAKRPMLSDLRESGGIEQAADMVMFLYRAGYYGITEEDGQIIPDSMAELIWAKHRNGALGYRHIRWVAEQTNFESYHDQFGSKYAE